MKIIIDKVTSEPNHSVSKTDIEIVLRHIPSDWVGAGNGFKISSQLFKNTHWDRPVIKNESTYIIMSRGFEKNYIIKELLIELAIRPSGKGHNMIAHHINKNIRKILEEMIQPYYDKIIMDLK